MPPSSPMVPAGDQSNSTRCWSFEDMNSSIDDADYTRNLPTVVYLHHYIDDSFGPVVPLLRQIWCSILSEDYLRGLGSNSEGIQRLKQDLSGIPCTLEETGRWLSAQKLSDGPQRRDELHQLLKNQFRDVCRDFQLVSESSEMSLLVNSLLLKIDGPWVKSVSDVHSIIKHLSDDGGHDDEATLQLHDLKEDGVCFVSQTRTPIGPCDARIRRRPRPHTFKRRQRVVRSIRTRLVYARRGARFRFRKVGVPGAAVSATPRRRRVPLACWVYETAAAIRRCHRRRPVAPTVCWVFDTGASSSATGNLSLLRGLHDAAVVRSCGANGAMLGSNKCGRVSGAVSLSGVRYFPGLQPNLISGGLFGAHGCETSLSKRIGLVIVKNGHLIGGGSLLPNGTYSLDFLNDTLLHSVCHHCPH